MLNIKYVVNADEKIVVAILEGTEYDVLAEYIFPMLADNKNASIVNNLHPIDATFNVDSANDYIIRFKNCPDEVLNYSKYLLKHRYVGIARCSDEDEFNEEYGKRIALIKLQRKYYKDKSSSLEKFLTDFENVCNNFMVKGYTMLNTYVNRFIKTSNFMSDLVTVGAAESISNYDSSFNKKD